VKSRNSSPGSSHRGPGCSFIVLKQEDEVFDCGGGIVTVGARELFGWLALQVAMFEESVHFLETWAMLLELGVGDGSLGGLILQLPYLQMTASVAQFTAHDCCNHVAMAVNG
jgi:hypothetical protein